jgi:hypothetical protein
MKSCISSVNFSYMCKEEERLHSTSVVSMDGIVSHHWRYTVNDLQLIFGDCINPKPV